MVHRMIFSHNPNLISRLSRLDAYKDRLYGVTVNLPPIDGISKCNQLNLSEISMSTIIDFISNLPKDDICFIACEDIELEVAILTSLPTRFSTATLMFDDLSTDKSYDLLLEDVREYDESISLTSQLKSEYDTLYNLLYPLESDSRVKVVEHTLDAPLSHEMPVDINQCSNKIIEQFSLTPNQVCTAQVNPNTFYLLFSRDTFYTHAIQVYLKERFSWVKEYFPDIWKYDAVLVYLSNRPNVIPDSMSDWILANPGKTVIANNFS